MVAKIRKAIRSMDFEERILHGGVLATAIFVIFPWFEGQRFCAEQACSGFGFLTGYIGTVVFLLQIIILAITFSPALGGPIIVRKSSRASVRFMLTGFSVVLILSVLSVLIGVFREDPGATIRFGIYFALAASIISCLYSFLKYQEQLKNQVQELFHHPEDGRKEKQDVDTPDEELPPPPRPAPPKAPNPEDHHNLFSS